MGLFDKQSKVKEGKQTATKTEDKRLFHSLGTSWKKLNGMDPKKAYTWAGIGIAGFIFLMMLGSMASSSAEKEDFDNYETRRYDLANMPFSSDEAEEYLLASRYSDMQEATGEGLYTQEEKEERQARDAESFAQNSYQTDMSSRSDRSKGYRGRMGSATSFRSGSGGRGGNTQVAKMSGASLKSGGGSGINATFGPKGDFSNFKSQDKGGEKSNLPTGPGSGDARKALFQTAATSRAAAGNKESQMLDAKKSIMGSSVEGDGAFMTDSEGVNLDALDNLALDEMPSTPDLSNLSDKLKDAVNKAKKDTNQNQERPWWQELLMDLAKGFVNQLTSVGSDLMRKWVGLQPATTTPTTPTTTPTTTPSN